MDIFISETKDTPKIHISVDEGLFEITGNSFSLSVIDFYKPILEWIKNDLPLVTKDLNCTFKLEIVNSETIKIFTEILFKLNSFYENGKSINIKWIFNEDDEDVYEIGIMLSEMAKIPFTFEMFEDLRN